MCDAGVGQSAEQFGFPVEPGERPWARQFGPQDLERYTPVWVLLLRFVDDAHAARADAANDVAAADLMPEEPVLGERLMRFVVRRERVVVLQKGADVAANLVVGNLVVEEALSLVERKIDDGIEEIPAPSITPIVIVRRSGHGSVEAVQRSSQPGPGVGPVLLHRAVRGFDDAGDLTNGQSEDVSQTRDFGGTR